jgi:hypothetical protein
MVVHTQTTALLRLEEGVEVVPGRITLHKGLKDSKDRVGNSRERHRERM